MPELSGNLTAFSVRQVLELLAATSKSGELRLRADHGTGRILLHEGDIAYATTATGADTVEELDRLLRRYQPGISEVEAGPETINLALEEQVTDVLHDALEWESGSFEFAARASSGNHVVHRSSVERALELVGRRRAEWATMRELIPTNDAVYRLAPHLPQGTNEATFDGLRWRLLALIGDGGSVDFIASELNVSDYRAAKLLTGLIEAGFVRPDEEDVDDTPAPVPRVFEYLALENGDHAPGDDEVADGFEDPIPDEAILGPHADRLPSVQPQEDAISFTASDLSQTEKDELIRNLSKGIYPTGPHP